MKNGAAPFFINNIRPSVSVMQRLKKKSLVKEITRNTVSPQFRQMLCSMAVQN